LASLALGIALGLAITWILIPVQFTNADVADMRPSYKDDYVHMISAAYQVDGDLGTAKDRLSQLEIGNPVRTLNDVITREKARSISSGDIDALTNLALALSAKPETIAARGAPSASETQTVVVVATPVESVPRFVLVEHTQLGCQDEPDAPHLRFVVRDAEGHDLPNVAIQVRWPGGDDTVVTGLKPERGVGYADYEATPGTFSATILDARGDTVSDLLIGNAPADCRADRGATPRGWKLVFQQK
jgi:hypothetical protein